jgi:alkylation response protein AidB-like acyl-CoA dehydrogenase
MWRADIVGCQLFSEPGAGSDLAALQTKAERDGDEWVITGQKVWTSGAHYSDIGEIICRTDADLPKHKGLTGFIVDMKAPGVEIRPLRQMTGGASFNEVFFTEVRVRDDHRLGDVNNGWNVALTTLMNERAAIGGGSGGDSVLTRVFGMVRHYGLDKDLIVRNKLADLVIRYRVASYNNQRALDKIRSGQTPGPEMSIAKMALTDNQLRLGAFLAEVLGPRLQADTGEWGTYAWNQLVLGTPGLRIAGGSDEVMRNIVGERVLGLPKDTGIDSKSSFRDNVHNGVWLLFGCKRQTVGKHQATFGIGVMNFNSLAIAHGEHFAHCHCASRRKVVGAHEVTRYLVGATECLQRAHGGKHCSSAAHVAFHRCVRWV